MDKIKKNLDNNNIDLLNLPIDFDWKVYISLNDDLKSIDNNTEASLHYLKNGIKENRLYKIDYSKIPKDFNFEMYIELNDDLKNIKNETEALCHYLQYGIIENRKYKKNIPVSKYTDEDYFDFIDENEILYTKIFFKENPLFLKYNIDKNIFHNFHDIILVIDFNNGGGGTTFFLNTIVSKYKNFATFLIIRFDGQKYTANINEEYLINEHLFNLNDIKIFINKIKIKINKIFVNSFIHHDSKFIDYIMKLDVLKVGITHDYYNIYTNPQPTFKTINDCEINTKININEYDKVITQNIENVELLSKYYKKNIDLIELPDYFKRDQLISTNNEQISCCIIGNINEIKGAKKLVKIVNYFKNNEKISFYIIGNINKEFSNQFDKSITVNFYNNISEFNNLLIKFKPNLLLELTNWPETYCYTLTLSMLTDLPILFYKKPLNCVVRDRLKNYKKSYEFNSLIKLEELIYSNMQNYFYTIYPVIGFKKYWNNLFIGNKVEKKIHNKNFDFKYDVKPYFIYFPQFHDIYENDVNFYRGYNDIKNLQLFNKNEVIKKEIPLNEYCNVNIYNYITNSSLLQKQINLIVDYGFYGLAIYYYWFTENSITNKNMIMFDVINKFFDTKLNFYNRKIFFIWANEDWTNNAALGESKYTNIRNFYDESSFIKNADNLINYFKNDNYLKIDNKPVFFIYHNYLIDNISEFYKILNEKCIANNFDGINLVLNSFEKENNNFKQFYINFNYKKYDARFFDNNLKKIKLDYKKYIDNPYHVKKDKIQTIVYDFDNRPRLYKPCKLGNASICINNTEMHKIVFTKKILETYNNSDYGELDKILLINALNEWGENMVFEPCDKYGYYNMNLLQQSLCI